jgi:CSLREA domain-containing protein
VVRAAIITVSTTLDDSVVNGNCTLREAITAANSNTAQDACTAGTAGADLITFARGLAGTVTLGSTLPNVSEPLTIRTDALGSVTLSGGGAVRILIVDAGAALTLEQLVLTAGAAPASSGAAVQVFGTLTLTNSRVTANSSAGGGAIFMAIGMAIGATATISGSTFSGNAATSSDGGAILVVGTLVVTASTFTGNTSPTFGGAIAILVVPTVNTVTNSTFVGNASPNGGAVVSGATLTVTHSTFSGIARRVAGCCSKRAARF